MMMYYYQLTVFMLIIFFIILSKLKSGSIVNPVSIFCFFWGGSTLLSSFDLADIILPSIKTFNYLLLTLVVYSLGGLTFLNKVKVQEIKVINDKTKMPFFLNLLFYYQIIVVFIIILFINKGIGMIESMGPGEYRGLVNEGADGVFGRYKIYVDYFIQPSIFLFAIVSISGFFLKVLPVRYLLLSVINIILYCVVTLGRMPFMLLFCSFVFGFLYLKAVGKMKLTKKHVTLILLPVVLIVLMSVFRQIKGGNSAIDVIWTYFIWYFTGNFSMFDYFLNNYTVGIDYDYSYYRAVLAGIENVFAPIVAKVDPGYQEINKSLHDITAVFRNAGGGKSHNSNYSMLYAFYRDAGLIGVAFYSYLFGVINSLIYNSFSKKISLYNLSVLLLFTYMTVFSVFRWNFRYRWFWLILLGLSITLKKVILKQKNINKLT